MDINYQSLKAQQREQRDGYSINLGLRVHRALSWLNRSEKTSDVKMDNLSSYCSGNNHT
jgi:hypothetical protein